MRRKTLTLFALALLASASLTLSYTTAANVNRKPRPKRPSGAIGAGGAGTYARGARRRAPTAAPTPQTPNNNASFIGGSQDGVGIRRRETPNTPQSDNPTDANVSNANQTYLGTGTEGTGIRRRPPRKRRP